MFNEKIYSDRSECQEVFGANFASIRVSHQTRTHAREFPSIVHARRAPLDQGIFVFSLRAVASWDTLGAGSLACPARPFRGFTLAKQTSIARVSADVASTARREAGSRTPRHLAVSGQEKRARMLDFSGTFAVELLELDKV